MDSGHLPAKLSKRHGNNLYHKIAQNRNQSDAPANNLIIFYVHMDIYILLAANYPQVKSGF